MTRGEFERSKVRMFEGSVAFRSQRYEDFEGREGGPAGLGRALAVCGAPGGHVKGRGRGAMLLVVLATLAGCGEAREIAVRDLKQIAVVAWDARGPVIYYNPDRCVEVGRSLCAYERTHAHMLVSRGNVPRRANPADPYDTSWITPEEVLKADCRAANELRGQGQAAAQAAADFFRRQGDARAAPNYPTGSQRAAQILECLERY